MNSIQTLGFDNWFKDKIDLSKTPDSQIARVISVNKNSFFVSNGVKDIYATLSWTSRSYRDASNYLCHGANILTLKFKIN